MRGPDFDAVVCERVARRVQDILESAREREDRGQTLAVDLEARLRLEDVAAVQFQVASAILEETSGMRQEEVVCELLSLGLATVLSSSAQAVSIGGSPQEGAVVGSDELQAPRAMRPRRLAAGDRVLN